MSDTRRKKGHCNHTACRKTCGTINDAIAFQRTADFQLHDRHASQICHQIRAGHIVVCGLLDLIDDPPQLRALNASGSSASTISVRSPSFDRSLPRRISFDMTLCTSC
jgi:hypothetical protein